MLPKEKLTVNDFSFEKSKAIQPGMGLGLDLFTLGLTDFIEPYLGISIISVFTIFKKESLNPPKSYIDIQKSNDIILAASKFLKKYGKIPEISKIENSHISITLNSKNLKIDGFINFNSSRKKLSELKPHEIDYISSVINDEITTSILFGYIKFKLEESKAK